MPGFFFSFCVDFISAVKSSGLSLCLMELELRVMAGGNLDVQEEEGSLKRCSALRWVML
jgi:hypothetical protein